MLVRTYFGMWILGIIIVGLFYLTGNFTPIAALVFGFMSFGLVFMGMMSVLPATISHPEPEKSSRVVSMIKAKTKAIQGALREFRQTWMSADSVEVRRPRYR